MKIILLQDVPHVGRKFEIKDVKEGFGRNFLIPQGFAKFANSGALKSLEGEKKRGENQMAKETELFASRLALLKE